jgi:uncharacterized protein
MFNPEVDIDSNLEEMNAAIAHVKTGQVTYAIKDTTIDGKKSKLMIIWVSLKNISW